MADNELIRKMGTNISRKAFTFSPSQLAYAGDAVYELLVRSYIIENNDVNVNQMHKYSIRYVKAESQAKFIKELDCALTEEERKIVKRGRNTKVTSSPKNVDMINYRYATGFEALFGYLYLNNEIDRLIILFNKVIETVEKKDDIDEDN